MTPKAAADYEAVMNDLPVLVERRGPVLLLTLNNPRTRNGLTGPMADGIAAGFAAAARDDAVRAVLLRGTEGHFCSGADLSVVLTEDPDPSPGGRRRIGEASLVGRFHPALAAIWSCDKPVVAALRGATVGFGLSLALACDVRLMAEDAYLASGFLKIGLFPDGAASWQLLRLAGLARATELLLEPARRLSAGEAQQWGLVARVVPAARLEDEAIALAERLAAGPPLATRAAKRQLRQPAATFTEALAAEVAPVLDCLASDDAAEGLMAFFEKRPAAFKGT